MKNSDQCSLVFELIPFFLDLCHFCISSIRSFCSVRKWAVSCFVAEEKGFLCSIYYFLFIFVENIVLDGGLMTGSFFFVKQPFMICAKIMII
ncbi:hypothetical protein [Bacteroides salyersiae]|uniref:hypothetical protein n=1 Tax=Bacteroides salyersiae TaxID=291644 RepID=UPI001C8CC6C7|nr:hypothetical protein [Bacteroides salyersiae]